MPAVKHDFTVTEIKAGALVLASLVILAGFIVAIKGLQPRDRSAKTYHARFTDVGGLRVGADVSFGGVAVGKVVAIRPDQQDRTRIRVTVEVRGDVPVNHGSVASVGQVSLTTPKHLEISTGDGDQSLHDSGDVLRSKTGGGGLIDLSELAGVIARAETMLDGIVTLLGVQAAEDRAAAGEAEVVDLVEVFASLQATLDESTTTVGGVGSVINENREGIHELVARLVILEEAATELIGELNAAVAENRAPLNETMLNLQRLTAQLSQRIEELAASLDVTLKHLQDAGGNASDLIDDQRPTIEQILLDLRVTARNLSELSATLADEPQSLLRGKKPHGRESQE